MGGWRADSAGKAWRVDRAAIPMGGSTWTAEGYLRVPARIARPGILVYQTPGGTVRELVPASTLSDPEFLASLTGKPLTLEHPPAPLTPDTVGEYRVGTILSVEYIEGQGVIAQVQIENREAIKAVQAGKLEVSPSYITDTAPTPGVDPAFGRYDVIQTRRFAGNHVALTDLGRGGRDVRLLLRADSAEVEIEVGIEIPLSGEKMKLSPAVLALLATCGIDPAPFADDAAAIAAVSAPAIRLPPLQKHTKYRLQPLTSSPSLLSLPSCYP